MGKDGGPGRDRTDDLFHAMEARSQLRHRPTFWLDIYIVAELEQIVNKTVYRCAELPSCKYTDAATRPTLLLFWCRALLRMETSIRQHTNKDSIEIPRECSW